MPRNLGKNWAAECRPIEAYFVQDQVTPNEGPQADELSRREFAEWAIANPEAPIHYDADMYALFLCLDVTTAQGKPSIVPEVVG